MVKAHACPGNPVAATVMWVAVCGVVVYQRNISPKKKGRLQFFTNNDEGGGRSLMKVLAAVFFLPFLQRICFFLIREFLDPDYANPQCFLELVNSTNPEHYSNHPVWSLIQHQCEMTDPEQRQDFLTMQYNNHLESAMYFRLTRAWVVSALFVALPIQIYKSPTNRRNQTNRFTALVDLTFLLLVTERISVEVQGFIHLVNDVTQMNFTIMHHVPDWTGFAAIHPARFPPQFPHGAILTALLTQVLVSLAMGSLAHHTTRRYRERGYRFLCGAFAFAITFGYMKLHRLIHLMEPQEIQNSFWPYLGTFYSCHVEGHHGDGSCIKAGNDAQDLALFFVAWLLEKQWIVYSTPSWHLLCVIVEEVVLGMLVLKGFLLLQFSQLVQDYISSFGCKSGSQCRKIVCFDYWPKEKEHLQ